MSRILLAVLLLAVVLPMPVAAQAPVNIQFVFDASGSMAARSGARPRIESARAALEAAVSGLDKVNGVHVGFRVFGHLGDNSEAGRARSCAASELLVPMQGIDAPRLRSAAASYAPRGWTPIALALTQAGVDFGRADPAHNVLVLLSDGEETCFGDPCAAARALAEARAAVTVHVLGFGLGKGEIANLQCIANEGGGVFLDAQDGDELAPMLLGLLRAELEPRGHRLATTAVAIDLEMRGRALDAAALGLEAAEQGVEAAQLGVAAAQLGVDAAELGIEAGRAGAEAGRLGVQAGQFGASAADAALAAAQGENATSTTVFATRGRVYSGGQASCAGGTCTCAADSSCNMTCSAGRCTLQCEAGAQCMQTCSGGHCRMACAPGAECTMTCSGGSCAFHCPSGSRCATTCSGRNCVTSGRP